MTGNLTPSVVVIIGAGGIGVATARRIASGRLLVLADFNAKSLQAHVAALREEGHNVHPIKADISSSESVVKLAEEAASLGRIETVVNTAGLSPPLSPAKAIYQVNLVGTANVIEAFQAVLSNGSSLVTLSSAAAHFGNDLPEPEEKLLRTLPPEKLLLETPTINLETDDAFKAYRVSKKANILRMQAATGPYGTIGARINVVSPGVVATPMGQSVLEGPNGKMAKAMIAGGPVKRIATPADIAEAIAFLSSAAASYITGAELLIDGGTTAVQRAGR